MQPIIEPSEKALEIAARNGERDYFLYDIELFTRETFIVSRKDDSKRLYWVDLEDATCDCQAFERMGVCKHLWMVGEFLRVQEAEKENDLNWEAAADEYASPEYRRF